MGLLLFFLKREEKVFDVLSEYLNSFSLLCNDKQVDGNTWTDNPERVNKLKLCTAANKKSHR
jgi:hypothetical protein